jgi:hypothetical protein
VPARAPEHKRTSSRAGHLRSRRTDDRRARLTCLTADETILRRESASEGLAARATHAQDLKQLVNASPANASTGGNMSSWGPSIDRSPRRGRWIGACRSACLRIKLVASTGNDTLMAGRRHSIV